MPPAVASIVYSSRNVLRTEAEGPTRYAKNEQLLTDCSGQKQREKTKGKGRCQCHARCKGQGENYGCRFHGSPLFSGSLSEQGKDFRDRHHVLELFGSQGATGCSEADEDLKEPTGQIWIYDYFGFMTTPCLSVKRDHHIAAAQVREGTPCR